MILLPEDSKHKVSSKISTHHDQRHAAFVSRALKRAFEYLYFSSEGVTLTP